MTTAIGSLRLSSLLTPLLTFFLLTTNLSQAQSTSQALDLNGSGAYADLGTVSPAGNFSTGLTFECWVKWDAFNNWSRLLELGNGPGSNNLIFSNQASSSTLRFEVYQGGTTQGVNSAASLVTGRWYHVAVTQTSTGVVTLYVDGVPAGNGTIQTPLDVSRAQCYIGRSSWAGDGYLDSRIDEVRIWSVVRTAAEIKQHLLRPVAPDATGLVAYYKCNEGSGTALVNASSNGVVGDATVAGGLAWISSPVQPSPNAVNFDGVDDYVHIGAPLPDNTSYTKEAWVYMTNTSGPRNVVSSNNSPLWIDGGILRAGNNGPSDEVTDPTPIPAGTCVHVAVSYDAASGNMSLYRNGNLVDQAVTLNSYLDQDNFIGAWDNGTSTESYMAGSIDEVRIWNTARTQSQIQSAMSRELDPATESKLVAYYTFNQGIPAGTNTGMVTVIDQKGTINGTFTNALLSGATSNFVSQQSSLVLLPVRLVSFTARPQSSHVRLLWSTATEENAMDFVVEHSTNNRSWTVLGTVAAAGNSSTLKNYSYVHESPAEGNNYYRLRQRDSDGKNSLSPVRLVAFSTAAKAFSLQNTVVNQGQLQLQVNHKTTLSVFTPNGKLLMFREYVPGRHTLELGPLPKGIYYASGSGISEKFVVR